MAKYRKKPVVIEAIQLKKSTIKEVYSFIYGNPKTNGRIAQDKWYDYEQMVVENGLRLKTLESDNETQKADINDFIIKGVQGEFYPCKPDIFLKTYDKI